MSHSCLPKHLLTQFDKENLFEFKYEEHIYALVGYPHWRAFIITPKSDLKLEVYPRINTATRKLEFLEDPQTSKANDRIYLKVENSAVLKSYLEKEKRFFDAIPEEIINRVKVYKDSHWEILKAVIVYGHHFVTLIDANPVLAYLLVNLDKINTSFSLYIDKSYMETLITEKQKEILELADFPATKSMVKIFTKFPPGLIDVECLNGLKNNMLSNPVRQEKILKILSHARVVNKNLFQIIAYNPAVLDVMSIGAVQELVKSESFTDLLDRIKKMYAKGKKWYIKFEIPELKSFDKFEDRFNAAIQKRIDAYNYLPPAPIPDGEGIYALKTVAEQKAWGRKQHNCIGGQVYSVKNRQKFLYKVILNKEEATLEIKMKNGKCELGDLLGKRNTKVSKELRSHVWKWFRGTAKSKSYKMQPMLLA